MTRSARRTTRSVRSDSAAGEPAVCAAHDAVCGADSAKNGCSKLSITRAVLAVIASLCLARVSAVAARAIAAPSSNEGRRDRGRDHFGAVFVAALGNGNDAVAVDESAMSLVSIAMIRSSSTMPRSYRTASTRPPTFTTSRCAAKFHRRALGSTNGPRHPAEYALVDTADVVHDCRGRSSEVQEGRGGHAPSER
jgi:hypothetical protein